jgi:antitoxin (DNA-binding transcriptional repressor) of toxin-antitoxin stability system
MKVVGIRELKNRLSEYLRIVRNGEEVLVTDRGEAVAELRPPGEPHTDRTCPPELIRLSRRGRVMLGAPNDAAIYPKLKRVAKEGTAARLLAEERGEH